jgi:hypothetical protein
VYRPFRLLTAAAAAAPLPHAVSSHHRARMQSHTLAREHGGIAATCAVVKLKEYVLATAAIGLASPLISGDVCRR